MLRNYPGFDWNSLSRLSIKRFWFLNRQIDRLMAEEDLRQMQLLSAVNSSEGFTKLMEGLETSMGQIFVSQPVGRIVEVDNEYGIELTPEGLDPEFDRAGLQALRNQNYVNA